MYAKLVLTLTLFSVISSVQALDCQIVAKIYFTDIINEVSIWRKGAEKPTWASEDNRKLCAGDFVIAPNRPIPAVTIRYYTEVPRMTKLKKGESYRTKALQKPCGMWCTAQNDIQRLYHKFTSKVAENIGSDSGGGRGDGSKVPLNIAMSLDIKNLSDSSFYLFAHEGVIPLFWEGGKSPYQLEVKDAIGNVVTNNKLKDNIFSLIVPNTEPEQIYTLKISDANGVSYQNQLIFAIPPFPLDPKTDRLLILARLLNDPHKNWRLEIWRQLATIPKNQARENFKERLKAPFIFTQK